MKLIDLLVKELPKRGGWPDGVAAMAQDANGAVQNYRDTYDIRIDPQHAFGTSRIIGSYSIAEDEVSAATDRLASIITRAQYEAALAKNDGWIEWGGDLIPPIGCECEMQDSRGAWLPVVIIAKNDGFTFGWSYDYRIVLFGDKSDEFRPLRTEAEKAREAACRAISHILDEDRNFQFNSKKIYDAIAAGKIPGVKLED